jgi:hypothetical protein
MMVGGITIIVSMLALMKGTLGKILDCVVFVFVATSTCLIADHLNDWVGIRWRTDVIVFGLMCLSFANILLSQEVLKAFRELSRSRLSLSGIILHILICMGMTPNIFAEHNGDGWQIALIFAGMFILFTAHMWASSLLNPCLCFWVFLTLISAFIQPFKRPLNSFGGIEPAIIYSRTCFMAVIITNVLIAMVDGRENSADDENPRQDSHIDTIA